MRSVFNFVSFAAFFSFSLTVFASTFLTGFEGAFLTGFAGAFLTGALTAFFTGAGFFTGAFFAAGFGFWADDFAFLPTLSFNLLIFPTTAFLVKPSLLPISAVDIPRSRRTLSFEIVPADQELVVAIIHPFYYNPEHTNKSVESKVKVVLTIAYITAIISSAAIIVMDIRHRLIPDMWLWPFLLSGLYVFGENPEHITAAILGYVIGFVLLWAMYRYKKDALGYGDVKLLSVAGLWLGVNGLSLAVVYACAIGIAYGLARKQRYIPFAPFMFAGAGIYLLTQMIVINV